MQCSLLVSSIEFELEIYLYFIIPLRNHAVLFVTIVLFLTP
jgi:hypothetical protein